MSDPVRTVPATHPPIDGPPPRGHDAAAASRGALGVRLAALGLALLSGGFLAVAASLDPAPEGLGTHVQLGLRPCGWPAALGIPCPTCGMTTAAALAADGQIVAALHAQPAGAVLAVAAAGALLLSLHGVVTGVSPAAFLRLATASLGRGRLWWAVSGLILGGWMWKILTSPA